MVVLFGLLKPLLDAVGEKGTLLVGLFANLAFTIYYAFFVTAAWQYIGAGSVYVRRPALLAASWPPQHPAARALPRRSRPCSRPDRGGCRPGGNGRPARRADRVADPVDSEPSERRASERAEREKIAQRANCGAGEGGSSAAAAVRR